jgi:hypothetical protein
VRAGIAAGSRFVASALAAVLTIGSLAYAQSELAERTVRVAFRDGRPLVTASLVDLADARVRRSLESGLRKSIVVTVQAFQEGSDRLVAQTQETCFVTYDLWEDNYVVRTGRNTAVHGTIPAVLSACLSLRRLPVGDASRYERLSGRRIYFALRAEFNPISRSRCSRLLGNAGSDDPIGPVVVNIVRREICQAERSIDFRSQPVPVP